MTLKDAQLHVKSNGESYIEANLYFSSTRVFDGACSDQLVQSYDYHYHSNHLEYFQPSSYWRQVEMEEEHLQKIYQRAMEKADYAFTHIDPHSHEYQRSVGILTKEPTLMKDDRTTMNRSDIKVTGHFIISINAEQRIYRIQYELTLEAQA